MNEKRKKQKIENIMLAISGAAFWCLMMPANSYGILGIPVFTVLLYLALGKFPGWLTAVKKHFKPICLLPVALLYYVLFTNFYGRWSLSGMVKQLAGVLGCSNRTLILLGAAVLGCLALLFFVVVFGAVFGVREKETDSFAAGDEERRGISAADFAFCAVTAACFALLLALQPWSEITPGTDSAVFLYIGQRMKEGLVPYTDLFDHKGLILYFLEYLGAVLTPGSFTGMWFVELLNLFAAAVFVFLSAGLFSKRKELRYLAVVLVLATFDCYLAYEGGNLVEEFALPWMLLALYIFLKYFMKGTYRFFDIVLLGISFAVVFFLRENMIAIWAAFLPVVFFLMLWKKQWKDIGKCIFGFVAGCAVVVVPILIYAAKAGCLDTMYAYYFEFNFGYSDSEGSILANLETAWFLLKLSFVYFSVFVITLCKFARNRIYRLNLWFTLVSLLLASMSGRSYSHYGIILMPTLVVPLILLLAETPEKVFRHPERILWLTVSGALLLKAGISILSYQEAEPSVIAAYMQENTEASDNVLVIGNACSYYLESGRTTTNRFFYQNPPVNISDELYEEFAESLYGDMPDMVIVIGNREDFLENTDNLAKVCGWFEEQINEGVYSVDMLEGFFAYQLQ